MLNYKLSTNQTHSNSGYLWYKPKNLMNFGSAGQSVIIISFIPCHVGDSPGRSGIATGHLNVGA